MKKIFTLFVSIILFANINLSAQDLIITGVFDGPLPGGVPKGVELFVVNDIADMSQYGLESANNGGGASASEFDFPADSYSAGDFIYVGSEDEEFNNFFGFTPEYVSDVANVNGDDAILLYFQGTVIDVFGDPDMDGTGEPWEYLDGWAYRTDDTGPDASFELGNWTFSGINAFDGETTNGTAAIPFPNGTFVMGGNPSVATPVITPGSGQYTDPISVEISCSTDGADIYYTIDGTDPSMTSTEYTVAINITDNTTVKAKAYKTGLDESNIATNVYTFPTIVEVADLAELRTQAIGDVIYKVTGEVVVTFAQDFRSQKYVEDASAAVLIDDNDGVITSDYIIGDGISNLSGQLSEYGGMLQFIPIEQGTETSSGNTITSQTVTIQDVDVNFEDYEAELVTIIDVEFQATGVFENGTVYEFQNENSNSYEFRSSFYDVDYIGTDIATGFVSITGVMNSRTDGEHITARSAADIISSDVSVNEISNDDFRIYPNPAIDRIKFSHSLETQNIMIYDVYGKMVLSLVVNSNDSNIDISDFESGVYFVKIIGENTNTIITKKFIKK